MARSYFDDEPNLKKRPKVDTRPHTECPCCLKRAVIVSALPDSDDGRPCVYVVCAECSFHGEVIAA